MGKKTLILHIGQSKAGTSSIQKFCQTNRMKLAAEGVAYPSVKKSGVDVNLLEHNAFAETLCGIQRYPYLQFEEYVAQFFQCQQDKMLLSAESFWGVPHIWTLNSPEDFLSTHRKKLEKLKTWTKEYNLEIILYLRHPLEWFKSSVSHIIRHEGLLGKKIYQSDEQLYELLKPHMDYMSLISLWNDVLQPDKFSIKAFERKQLIDGDAVADFCDQIGYQGIYTKEFEENSGWPAEITLFKKELNAQPKAKWRERSVIQILARIARKYPGRGGYDISVALQQQIIDDTHTQVQQLAERYQVVFDNVEIIPPSPYDKQIAAQIRQDFYQEYKSIAGWGSQLVQLTKREIRQRFTTPYNMIKMIAQKQR